MMTIAKRKLILQQSELLELFNLPEGVEVLSATVNNHGEVEFLLVSREEVFNENGVQVTVKTDDHSNVRRLSLKHLKSEVATGGYTSAGFRIDANGLSLVDAIGDMTIINGNEKIAPLDRYNIDITINQIGENPAEIARRIGESLKSVGERIKAEKKPKDESIENVFEQAVNNATKKKGNK